MKNYQVNKIVKDRAVLVKEVETLDQAHAEYASIKGKKEIKSLITGKIISAQY